MSKKEVDDKKNSKKEKPFKTATDENKGEVSNEITKVKNANAAGLGAIGRNDERLTDDDESDNNY